APYVLDEILGNATDLPIIEHATDTHGATLANFALSGLVGKQLSPRIRDLGKITLARPGPRAEYVHRYPQAGPLLTRRLQTGLIAACWDDLLRVAASVHGGHATAALVVGKLCSPEKQQNTLTAAMKEHGLVRRTIYAARYLADETYQRRIGRQLNKGENVHTLRRDLAHAHQGKLRRRYPEQQTGQMWCLALATNAIVCWMAEYLGLAVAVLRATGRHIDDEMLAHVWPTRHENVLLYGTRTVDIDAELAGLDAAGYRPLRRATRSEVSLAARVNQPEPATTGLSQTFVCDRPRRRRRHARGGAGHRLAPVYRWPVTFSTPRNQGMSAGFVTVAGHGTQDRIRAGVHHRPGPATPARRAGRRGLPEDLHRHRDRHQGQPPRVEQVPG
ncbi:MAG: Tn3 family transposase, partial [Streptosporangiaceae bacterium]